MHVYMPHDLDYIIVILLMIVKGIAPGQIIHMMIKKNGGRDLC